MTELHFLRDLIILMGMTIPVVLICHRLRIPSILGFLLTGALTGPHGFRLIIEHQNIHGFAEFGIVALMFTIGLEFSMQKIWTIKRLFIAGGFLQVCLTVAVITLIVMGFGYPFNQSLFAGFLVSLSSTAMVLSILQEQRQIDSPHGKVSLAILIFQDVSVVAMILLLPLLSGKSNGETLQIPLMLLKAGIVAFVVYAGMRWVIPYILYRVVKTKNRELFLFAVLFLCLSIGYLTSSLGLSLALGAFLAGLMISESDYSHRAMGSILPLKDIFSSLFFISIGMLFDIQVLFQKPLLIIGAALAIMLIKGSIVVFTALLLRRPISTAVKAGASLSQIGEFSFVLFQAGTAIGMAGTGLFEGFLGISLCTMFLTPLVMKASPAIAKTLCRIPMPSSWRGSVDDAEVSADSVPMKDHLVIIGFGLVGRTLAEASRINGIPYVIIEMNPDTVADEKKKGEPIFYGDASHSAVLKHLNIAASKVVVIAISDPHATTRITELARCLNPHNLIITRTRFLADVDELSSLGASYVIPEEFETSIEIFAHVLRHYVVPGEDIDRFIHRIRSGNYKMQRPPSPGKDVLYELLDDPESVIQHMQIKPGSPLAGRTLQETGLREKCGVTVLAIRRESVTTANPSAATQLQEGDVLIIMGSTRGIQDCTARCGTVLESSRCPPHND